MELNGLDKLGYLETLWILLKGLDLPKTMIDELFRCEEQSGAFAALELLNARFLHSLAQMLYHILRSLVPFDEIRPSVLITTDLTIIYRVFLVK